MMHRVLILGALGVRLAYCGQALQPPATAPAKPSVQSSSAAVNIAGAQVTAAQGAAPQGKAAGIAARQTASVEKMFPSIDKQRVSVQSQVGAGGPADSFFAAAWTTLPAIPIPGIIPACQPMPEDQLQTLVADSAKTQDIKAEVIRAVIRRESNSYACAVSDKGALGLMQLMPEVAQQFGADSLDPRQNVQAGSQYLKQLMTRYKGDLRLALAAYNAGPQRVDADKKVPDIPETVAYVDAILKDLTPTAATSR
jgi:soluble lytic murein transglycosylase-like protein